MIVSTGLSGIIHILLTGNDRPTYIAIGTGSQTVSAGTTTLATETGSRRAFELIDDSTNGQVQWEASWSPSEMSGLSLREIGVFVNPSGGNALSLENFPAVTFDGTNELKVAVLWEVY